MKKIIGILLLLAMILPVEGVLLEEQIGECLIDSNPDICLSMLSLSGSLSQTTLLSDEELVNRCFNSGMEGLCINAVAVSLDDKSLCSTLKGTSREYCQDNFKVVAELSDDEGNLMWLAIVVIGIGLVGIAIYLVLRQQGESKTKTRDELLQLQNYIRNASSHGYSNDVIRVELEREGWSKEVLDRVFQSLNQNKTVNRVELLQLQNYILESRRSRIPDSKIRETLIKDGWDEALVDRALSNLS